MDELDHVLFGRRTTVAEVHAHAAQADFRNRDAALSENALFHFHVHQNEFLTGEIVSSGPVVLLPKVRSFLPIPAVSVFISALCDESTSTR